MAYVMLTGADGFPEVLNNLCLHCENRKLVSGFIFLAHWLSEVFFFFLFFLPLAEGDCCVPRSHPSDSSPTQLLSISPLPASHLILVHPFPPLATSSGRLALHGHVSTTDAPLTQGGRGWGRASGGGGGWLCGLFYLISVSTRASV